MGMQEKIEHFIKLMDGERGSYVPTMPELEPGYCCEYAGVDPMRAFWEYDGMIAAYQKVLQDFEIDISLGLQFLSPQRSALLGSRTWIQNRENGTMQHPEVTALLDTEYEEFLSDPLKCILERVLPRMNCKLEGDPSERTLALCQAVLFERNQNYDFYGKLTQVAQQMETPLYYGTMFYAPFDLLADHLRGIRQICTDMRRRPEPVEEACETIAGLMLEYVPYTLPLPKNGFPFACAWVHLPPMIAPKQFERFFWPSFRRVCDALAVQGYRLYLQFQGDYTDGKYYDYYQELPQGKCVLAVEKQNIEKTVHMLAKGNLISCSYPVNHLKTLSEGDCLKKAGELLDAAMPTGRCYFGTDKSVFGLRDADPEKLKAVLRFVHEKGRY